MKILSIEKLISFKKKKQICRFRSRDHTLGYWRLGSCTNVPVRIFRFCWEATINKKRLISSLSFDINYTHKKSILYKKSFQLQESSLHIFVTVFY
jgi:hypothetical protein